MTPKEKAEKLLSKMLSKNPNIQDGLSRIDTIQAKLCALIAVDEIIKSNPCYEGSDRGGNFQWNDNTYYWQEVKQEIEKL